MEHWHCFKCNEKMEESAVRMTYLKIGRRVPGLKCPKCGAAYLTEQIVEETVSKGEEQIESKM